MHGEAGRQDLLAARFNPDGTLDASFGRGGTAILDLGGIGEAATDVVVQRDGAVVVVGSVDTSFTGALTTQDMVVVRYRPNGTLDPGFGNQGVLRVKPGSSGSGEYIGEEAVALTASGEILVGGNAGIPPRSVNYPIVARVRADGTLDPSVGSVPGSGIVFFGHGIDRLNDMSLDVKHSRLYLAGLRVSEETDATAMYVAAVRPDLSLDSGFGTGGVALADFPGTPQDVATSVVHDRRGRVVLAGSAAAPPRARIALARVTTRGRLDRTFGRRGKALASVGRGYNVARALIEQPRGRLLAVGSNGGSTFGIAETGRAITLTRFIGN